MKPAARNFSIILPAVVWLALCVAPAPVLRSAHAGATPAATAPAPRTTVRDLLALGTDDRFWSADVIPFIQGQTSGTKTFLRVRGAGDSQWRLIGELEAPAVSLANRGNELLVVLEGGDWKIISDSGARSGKPLPGRADVLGLAGDDDDIWAIAAGPVQAPDAASPSTVSTTPAATGATTTTGPATTASASPATAPVDATTPPTATTAPAVSGEQLSLYQLTRGDWTRRDALPPGLTRQDLRGASLAVLDQKLMLALLDREGVVRIFTRRETGGWGKGREITGAGQTRLRLLDLRGRPALWVSDNAGPGVLYTAADGWKEPVRLAPSPEFANFDRTALATALGQLRLLASDGKQRLAEQIYNEDGSLSGRVTDAVTAPSPLDNRVAQLIQMFVVAVLFIWMMGALRQRPETHEAAKRVHELNLAPLGRRAIGGAIDLLPILIGLFVAAQFTPPAGAGGADAGITYASPQFASLAAGIAIYLLHTTACELLFARSLGKFATGTRVAALDGTRPTAVALLTRNLLRIVDIILVFPPIFVLFSPLRQRVGDMAAGTLVVMTTPMEPVGGADAPARDDDASSTPPPSTLG